MIDAIFEELRAAGGDGLTVDELARYLNISADVVQSMCDDLFMRGALGQHKYGGGGWLYHLPRDRGHWVQLPLLVAVDA